MTTTHNHYGAFQSTLKSADRLTLSDPSLIDTIYTSKHKKRPVWLTSTLGPVTTLFSVSSSGRLDSFAAIHWDTGVAKSDIRVEMGDESLTAERFGMKTQGFLGGNTK